MRRGWCDVALDLVFRIAVEEDVLEQVHRLNYATFVEEIPQHPPNPERRLVDRFHEENTYLVCLDGDTLAGMSAVRDQRPFSLDAKVDDLDAIMPADRPVCEVRLWTVAQEYRDATVMIGLRDQLWDHCTSRGYALAVISGTTRQARLYAHLGFVPFGPRVGTEEAPYQPMYYRFADHDLGRS
jgi:hypothetical protein